MISRRLWIIFSVIASLAAIRLYMVIDSVWAQDNHASIVITIAFFACAASAIVCAFNAVDAPRRAH